MTSSNLPDHATRLRKRVVSARKSEANRQNALRSTGPRTARGKAKSRGNALKHGFFARDFFTYFAVQRENPQEFQDLVARLRADWKPVGRLEELEVEHIAVCWWKRLRLWRYENAEMRGAQGEVAVRGLVSNPRELMLPKDKALIALLESAEKEIQSNGAISPELKDKILASDPAFRERWSDLEQTARKIAEERQEQAAKILAERSPGLLMIAAKDLAERHTGFQTARDQFIALLQVKLAIKSIVEWTEQQYESVMNVAYERQAIPSSEALDKILRYGGTIERELNRAYERLERLQRRRIGETVPPAVNLSINT
jgi:hypothetical protein